MRPTSRLDSARTRAVQRRLVRDRGPDAGRAVDRLKLRSGVHGDAAEQLLRQYELGQLDPGLGTDLTGRDGDATLCWFMLGVSELDGADTLA
ncbi:MAG: hypothetical protein HYU66_01665 [Armatimonadetes bacterium]|nr:hypothetical protein [Armatimonadota bacterium]